MFKLEVICSGCESHYIVVTQKNTNINYCPFCSEPYSEFDSDNDELDDGDELDE